MQPESAVNKIIIYGVPNPQRMTITQVLNNKITVSPLAYYSSPTKTQKGYTYLEKVDLQMWAYPDGIRIYDEHFKVINDAEPEFSFFQNSDILADSNANRNKNKQFLETIYSFVLTDYELNRTYCTSLTWNEKCFIKDDRAFETAQKSNKNIPQPKNNKNSSQEQKQNINPTINRQTYSMAVPKCRIDTMVNNPLLLDINTVLVYVPKVMMVCSSTPCIQFQRALLKYYYMQVILKDSENVLNKNSDGSGAYGYGKKVIRIPRILDDQFSLLVKNYGYIRAENKFNNDMSQTLKKVQMQLIQMIKNQSININQPNSNKNLLGCINVQTNNIKDFFISALFLPPKDPSHSYILTQNSTKICSRLKSQTVFHLPQLIDLFSQEPPLPETPLLPLPVKQLIQLYKCLLLQKQIIIFSPSQYHSLFLSQFMLHLIQPIKWQNIYIPFLPFHLAHHIDAIGGYLIGMSRIHMDYMLDKFDMKMKVVVDLQHGTILEEGGKDVIELPEEIQGFLESALQGIVSVWEEGKKSSKGIMDYLVLTSQEQSPEKQQLHAKQNYVKSLLQIQKAFFHAMVALFNNFIPFVTKKQEGIVSVETEKYLNIFEGNKSHRDFMKQISKTMVFIRLCEYHMVESEKCAWVQKTLGELFVYSHDILSHKFVIEENGSKKVSAWKVSDLLKPEEKYCQFIGYLFDKNLKQIVNIVVTIQNYLIKQSKKYNFLMNSNANDNSQFGQISKYLENGSKLTTKQSQQLKIYQQQQQASNRKWKKFGEKDEQDMYQQFSKICTEYKIQKCMIKYLKYIQLNNPQTVYKTVPKKPKTKKSKQSLIGWVWDLLNPPDSNRTNQQTEVKTKLQRKATISNPTNHSIKNLSKLFQDLNSGLKLMGQSFNLSNQKQNNQEGDESKKQDKSEDKLKMVSFLSPDQKYKKRPSHTQSDVVNFDFRTQQK